MRGQHNVNALKDACIEHLYLAAAALLGRSTKNDDSTRKHVQGRFRAQSCSKIRYGDEVVTTAVSNCTLA